MKILVFSWRDPKHPLAGGAEQVMHEHMKGWVAHGHKVTLFTSRFERSLKEESIDNIKIIRRGNQYHLGVQMAGFLYYLKNLHKYDLVVDQFHGMPFFTPIYVRKPKLAILQEVAREVWFFNPFPQPLRLIYGVLGYLLEPLVFVLYRRVHFMTGSESAKEDLSHFRISKKNITVVPHGVIVVQPKPFPKKEKIKTITFLGVLSPDKGIETALKCFYLLNKSGKFQFWVIGKPETRDYEKRLTAIVQNMGLESKIKFWGFVPQVKKFKLLARAHVLINPSIREGWGLVNIEANSMKTPVVSYRSKGLVDSVKHNQSGIICDQNYPASLADTIIELIMDTHVYNQLKESAYRWSRNFSWEKSRQLSLKLIEKIGHEY